MEKGEDGEENYIGNFAAHPQCCSFFCVALNLLNIKLFKIH